MLVYVNLYYDLYIDTCMLYIVYVEGFVVVDLLEKAREHEWGGGADGEGERES